jgi:uncharacterized protein (TIGR02246 family)
MRKVWMRIGVATAVVLGAVAVPPVPARAEAASRADAGHGEMVRELWAAVDATWNARDAPRFSDLFAVDASFQFVDRGEALEGRPIILQRFTDLFPTFGPDLRHRTTVREIRAVAPGVVATDVLVEILRTAPAGSAEPAVIRTFATFAVLVDTGEGWRIRLLRVFQLPIPSGSGAAG